jgi:site-specific DNA-methyltransferase (cytosine-N4-specific)
MRVAYETDLGTSLEGKVEDFFVSERAQVLKGQVDLIFTSPPFPLNRKKKYGNLQGTKYIEWLAGFGPVFRELLSPTGSIVIEIGNSWEPGRPVMSTLALRALLGLLDCGEFSLCQQFVWYNPAKLPSPAQWVNVERIRVKDAFTHIWWMSKTDRPKATNRNILTSYSKSMLKLLESQKYNPGTRPSEHQIGETSFLSDNNGAIPPNVITAANTHASSDYLRYCRALGLQPHPARMPPEVAEFFIKFLTDAGDLVFDPFGGSNTTGASAENLQRRWISVETRTDYIETSKGRFPHIFPIPEPEPTDDQPEESDQVITD